MKPKDIASKLHTLTSRLTRFLGERTWVTSPKDINGGWCWLWAKLAAKLLGSEAEVCCWEDPLGCKGHAFVKFGNRYYDAECPGGVTGWRQLPYFREWAHLRSRDVKVVEPDYWQRVWNVEKITVPRSLLQGA